MSECNHIYTLGTEAGTSAVLNGKCSLCGNRAANPTLESFEKVKPGDQDKLFQAACPKCDGRAWEFTQKAHTLFDEQIADPDCRVCKNCRYVHWLRGPNESEVIPLRAPPGIAKKDRVRALVLSMLDSPSAHLFFGSFENYNYILAPAEKVIKFATDLDRDIEATK